MNLSEEADICRRRIAITQSTIERFQAVNADRAVTALNVLLGIQKERLKNLEEDLAPRVPSNSRREDGYQPERETLAAEAIDADVLEMF